MQGTTFHYQAFQENKIISDQKQELGMRHRHKPRCFNHEHILCGHSHLKICVYISEFSISTNKVSEKNPTITKNVQHCLITIMV